MSRVPKLISLHWWTQQSIRVLYIVENIIHALDSASVTPILRKSSAFTVI